MNESEFDVSTNKIQPVPFQLAMLSLIKTIQQLSLARDLDTIAKIVRHAARELTGADGATFVLKDGDKCYYLDEEAISPLWKGQKFPMSQCVSGWVMLNRQSVNIKDIYNDPRVPIDAYRPTFVKSIVMVPIRKAAPIGAIGNYWASEHIASAEEEQLLQALADSASIAMENVQVYSELENRVKERTRELELLNKELEAFSYSISHDLRAPLQRIMTYSEMMSLKYAKVLDAQGKNTLEQIENSILDMNNLIGDMLMLSRASSTKMQIDQVNLSELAQHITQQLKERDINRDIAFIIEDDLIVKGDKGLLNILLENLLSNAWKYTSQVTHAKIEFGCQKIADGKKVLFIRDNGIGFDMSQADKLFTPFHRLQTAQAFQGTGIGLATVSRVIERHDGKIWVEATIDKGATFYFIV
ncbi:MAG: ATP-binding protein [Gammaproteobacteria bacterium]